MRFISLYLRRIGLTGRFGRSGIAINFVDGHRSMNNMREIERHFGRPIVELNTDDFDDLEQAVEVMKIFTWACRSKLFCI